MRESNEIQMIIISPHITVSHPAVVCRRFPLLSLLLYKTLPSSSSSYPKKLAYTALHKGAHRLNLVIGVMQIIIPSSPSSSSISSFLSSSGAAFRHSSCSFSPSLIHSLSPIIPKLKESKTGIMHRRCCITLVSLFSPLFMLYI